MKLARAHTGRDMIALCSDHPFFAVHDWFIGTTALDAGIPQSVKDLSVTFRYNDLGSVQSLFDRYPDRIAGLIMEPSKGDDPRDQFLHRVQELCYNNGALFILDEMITGFRWHTGGAQAEYGIVPDLSTFGKALANGFSVSALVGKREFMELGGIDHGRERVFLLSTTHGAETHSLAAAMATMQVYQQENVVEALHEIGGRLKRGADEVIANHCLCHHLQIFGRPCNLVFATRDRNERPSQAFRSLFLQELIKRGVSFSHTEADIDRTVDAIDGACAVYARALEDGVEKHLVGRPSKIVYRRYC
jgi:glutamate-1-semialdehyde 2,1-aminomutase